MLRKGFEAEVELADAQIGQLLTHALRLPVLFNESRELLKPAYFSDDERPYALVWNAASSIAERHGSPIILSPAFGDMLTGQVRQHMRHVESELTADEIEVLFGKTSKQRKKSLKGPKPLLQRIFETDLSKLELVHGRDLLKRFLKQAVFRELKAKVVSYTKSFPSGIATLAGDLQLRFQQIDAVGMSGVHTLAGGMKDYKKYINQFRGKDLIGLRTGLKEFDRHTLGVRGLTVIGARPNIGKTALAMHLALELLQQPENSNVGLLFLSLDMTKHALNARIQTNLANVDFRRTVFGPNTKQLGRDHRARQSLRDAEAKMNGRLGRRILIVDQGDIGDQVSSTRLAALIDEAKRKMKVTNILTVIDYLQLVEVPEEVAKAGDLAADKYRVKLLQDVMTATKSDGRPQGEPIIAIAEARKPASSKETWGSGLAELMGSSRLAYSADAVFSIREMTLAELRQWYGLREAEKGCDRRAIEHLEGLKTKHVSPLLIKLEKGRDGTTRGEWGMEFHYRTLQFTECELKLPDTENYSRPTISSKPPSVLKARKRRSRAR